MMWSWNKMRRKHFLFEQFMSLLDYIWCTCINLFDPKTFSFFKHFMLQVVLPMPIYKPEKMGSNLGWVKERKMRRKISACRWDEKMRYNLVQKLVVVVARVVLISF